MKTYNFAKHLKALRWRTPFEAITNAWTKDPTSFKIDPRHLILGPNILAASLVEVWIGPERIEKDIQELVLSKRLVVLDQDVWGHVLTYVALFYIAPLHLGDPVTDLQELMADYNLDSIAPWLHLRLGVAGVCALCGNVLIQHLVWEHTPRIEHFASINPGEPAIFCGRSRRSFM